MVEKRLQELETLPLASETRQIIRDNLTQTLAALQAIADLQAQARAIAEQAQAAPRDSERLKAQIASGVPGVSPLVGTGTPLIVLEQTLARAQADVKTLQDKQAAEQAEAERLQARRKDLPPRLAAARQRVEALTEQLTGLGAEAEESRVWLLAAQRAQAQEEARLRQLELDHLESFIEVNRLRRDLLALRLGAAEIEVESCRRLVDDRRRQEAERAAAQARELARDLGVASPLLAALAEENTAWAEKRRAGAIRLEEIGREAASLSQILTRLQDDHRALRDRLQAIGFSDAIGLLLRVKRAELPSAARFRQGAEQRAQEIAQGQLELIELEENLAALRDLDARARELAAGALAGAAPDRGQELESKIKALLRARREILESSQRDLSTRLTRLVDLDTLARQVARKRDEFAAFIDERVLWIRSTQPVGVSDLMRFLRGLAWIFSPARWAAVAGALWQGLRQKPLLLMAGLALWGLVLAARLGINRRLADIAGQVQRAATDNFRMTLETFLLTVVWAAPWPILMGVLSMGLTLVPNSEPLVDGMAARLAGLALPVWGLEVFRQVFRPDGLAERHCHWNLGEAHPLLRRQARWLGLIVVPLLFCTQVVTDFAPDAVQASLGRWLTIAVLLASAWLIDPLVRPTGPVMSRLGKHSQERLLYRLRYLLFFLGVVGPLLLAVGCLLGYVYTAQHLWMKAVATLAWILGAGLLYGLVWRALHVHRRTLALHKSQIMRAIADPAAVGEGGAAVGGPAPALTPPGMPATGTMSGAPGAAAAEPSIFQISTQTENLLYVCLLVALVVGVYHIWVDVFPALRILDRVKLWTTETQVLETLTGPDGAERREWVQRTVDITLFDLFLAVGIGFLTVTATRNVPGFIEFAVLQRLDIDVGMKFAVRTLASYLIGVLGFVVVMETIGLGWDKIQWLAAGISVGLGFGLQEIFANFVSGLILLFERPLRVGDIVTVGDVTGAVTRIQIRATTLLNADRKEVVIPNKELITGRLMNWTLTDPILRITFPVGVAYGSDPETVAHHLMHAARTHPRVLVDPAPQVVMTGFGESSLNFEVRVFIAGMDNFPLFQNDMNQRIYATLRANGIEIPFPQRDVTIKNWRPGPGDGPAGPPPGRLPE
ncbi:MAG: Potassium efflux system KefA protein / Small-conductance mechanosensitive channel [Candidatus Ozemobacter sibiricus]|uniref:Potassium efflux system KefA protein / Small-conductance mechanosensitive channel n=1 Tax=Candidatus Ozemobacter sibiricus TaxID=2268124 RepID=A0A367ZKC2_9BACT|nr:MAG: Potassium efflux system KefA protein / Small-conductance mechanosensitive channel [Candidatus Ozemobacter sibiricus]